MIEEKYIARGKQILVIVRKIVCNVYSVPFAAVLYIVPGARLCRTVHHVVARNDQTIVYFERVHNGFEKAGEPFAACVRFISFRNEISRVYVIIAEAVGKAFAEHFIDGFYPFFHRKIAVSYSGRRFTSFRRRLKYVIDFFYQRFVRTHILPVERKYCLALSFFGRKSSRFTAGFATLIAA